MVHTACHIQMKCCRKMSAIAFVITGQRDTLYQVRMLLRQTLLFSLVQIDNKGQWHRSEIRNAQQSDETRFDQPPDAGGRAGDYLPPVPFNIRAIVSHQTGAKRHQLQRQGRFPRA